MTEQKKPKNDIGGDDKTVFVGLPSGVIGLAPKAKLRCTDDALSDTLPGLRIRLTLEEQTIGRSDDNSVCIQSGELSRRHARIFPENDAWTVEDLNSTNGVFVNDVKVTRQRLQHGDQVKIGTVPFVYELERPDASGPSVRPAPVRKDAEPAATMYAGHIDVLQNLSRSSELEEDRPEKVSKPRSTNKPSAPVPKAKAAKPKKLAKSEERSNSLGKLLFYTLALVGLVGAGYFYLSGQRSQEIDALTRDYSREYKQFLDTYEGDGAQFSKQLYEIEMSEIGGIAARVEVAAKQYPGSHRLPLLQAKLIFLKFERQLNFLLVAGKIDAAEELIGTTQKRLSVLNEARQWNREEQDTLQEIGDLTELGKIITRFRLFRQRYPDPGAAGPARPTKREMLDMQNLKTMLVKKKTDNHLVLSVTYSYFQRMLSQIDEYDLRLLNRWKEVLRRAGN